MLENETKLIIFHAIIKFKIKILRLICYNKFIQPCNTNSNY